MWNRPHPIVICCVIIVFTAVRTNQNEQEPSTTIFDENKFIHYSGCALASSPILIKNLSENEELIYIIIKDYYHRSVQQSSHLLQPTVKPLQVMHRYLLNFEMTTGQLQLNLKRQKDHSNYRAFKVVWNPLTTYFMLQRFMKPLPEIVRSLDVTKDAQFSLQKQILNIMESTGWPTEEDVKGALSAILRIQHIYDLNTFQLSIGNLAGTKTHVNISSVDCLEIGKQALSESYVYLAIEWFETALWRFKWAPRLSTAEISDSTYPEAIEYYIALAKELHDSQWSLEVWDVMLFTTPSTEGRYRRRTSELETWKGNRAPQFVEANYWGTCSGGNYKSENEKSKLFCWYETEVNPLFKINPLKAEILSFEPLLVIQYYDLIGDKMIEKIKQDTSRDLRHSTVVSDDIQTSVLTSARTSLNSWINDNKREEFFPIPDIIEAVTGLKVRNSSSSEMLQVAAYTTGSHYSVHQDALRYESEMSMISTLGDRIATFVLYLSDVEKGGGTSFPQSGIASDPIKGSAVLWYNLLRNGETDEFIWHGACPVIIGEKWISNKWIRVNDQMFLKDYQCVPDQTARFMIRVNGKDMLDFF